MIIILPWSGMNFASLALLPELFAGHPRTFRWLGILDDIGVGNSPHFLVVH
jgi:hypothetical protein